MAKTYTLYSAAEEAIERSVMHDKVVTLHDPGEAVESDLWCESDDCTEYDSDGDWVVEYWGVTDRGAAWRVRVACSEHRPYGA